MCFFVFFLCVNETRASSAASSAEDDMLYLRGVSHTAFLKKATTKELIEFIEVMILPNIKEIPEDLTNPNHFGKYEAIFMLENGCQYHYRFSDPNLKTALQRIIAEIREKGGEIKISYQNPGNPIDEWTAFQYDITGVPNVFPYILYGLEKTDFCFPSDHPTIELALLE
jgi:hypothetical protein